MFFRGGINHRSKNEMVENRQELVMSASVFSLSGTTGALDHPYLKNGSNVANNSFRNIFRTLILTLFIMNGIMVSIPW